MEQGNEKNIRKPSIKIILIFIIAFAISLNFLYLNRSISYTNYVRIEAESGGATIYANLYIPNKNLHFQEKCPLIIYCHGLAGQRDIDLRIPVELTKRGFFVASLDYQGHGESEGYVLNLNLNKSMPAIAQDCSNLLDVIESMDIYSQINSSQIGLVGHSLGGMVVLMNAALDSRFKATVTWAGLVNFDLEKLGVSENGTYAKYLPVNLLNNTNPSNLLMIHHENDPIVSYANNAIVAQNLTNCELITIRGNLIGGPHFLMTDVTLYETINWFESVFFGSETINGTIVITYLLNYILLFFSLAAMFCMILTLINYYSYYFKFARKDTIKERLTPEVPISKKFKQRRIFKIGFYYTIFILVWVIFFVNLGVFGLFLAAIIFFISYSLWKIRNFIKRKKDGANRDYVINKIEEQFKLNEIGYSILSSATFLGFYLLFTITYPFGFVFPSSFLNFILASAGFPIYLALETFYRKIIYPKLNFLKEKSRTITLVISVIAIQFMLYGFTWNFSILPGVLTTHIIIATVIIINTFVYAKTKHFSSVFIVSYLIIQLFFGAGISQVLGIRNILTLYV